MVSIARIIYFSSLRAGMRIETKCLRLSAWFRSKLIPALSADLLDRIFAKEACEQGDHQNLKSRSKRPPFDKHYTRDHSESVPAFPSGHPNHSLDQPETIQNRTISQTTAFCQRCSAA